MVDFAGWHMPVQFSGLVDEHTAVRQRAGLFDVSHMGEIRLRGVEALANVQRLMTNDAGSLAIGQAQYTAMTQESGGIVDDLLVHRVADDDYFLVVNAGTKDKDYDWISSHLEGDVAVDDESSDWAQLAIQGPRSETILGRVVEADLAAIRYYRFALAEYGGAPAMISRTGYTGEDGFEIYLAPQYAEDLADKLMEAGAAEGIVAAGLGARDTLRLEAGLLLYGSDMDDARTPIEAGIGWVVKPDKGEFIGRQALMEQRAAGPDERVVGLEIPGRGIPRHGYSVLDTDGVPVGTVTSGTFSPTLRKGIGFACIRAGHAAVGTEVAVEIRGRATPARVVKTPFYRRQS